MQVSEFHIPRFKELPRVPLYKDQVIIYLESLVNSLNISNVGKLISPTMINNYVKQKVVSPPKDKKYNEKHLAYLIVVCVAKQVFSIQEICNLINLQIKKCPIEVAYDYFCLELEEALKAVFIERDFTYPSLASKSSEETEIVRSVVMAVAHKLFIQKQLKELEKNETKIKHKIK